MNNPPTLRPLSENERAAWRKQNLEDLAESVALPFEEKMAILEDLEQRLIRMGYQRDRATGRLYKPLNKPAEAVRERAPPAASC